MSGRLKRLALGLAIVVGGLMVAKMAQYAAVEHFGAALGFDLASAIGVIPVVALFLWLAHRFPVLRRQGGARG